MASRPNSGLFLLNKLFQMWLKWNMPETKYVSFKKHLTWSNFKDFGGLLGIETCLWKLNFIDFERLVIFLFHKILKFLLTTVFQGWVLQCMRMHQNDVFLDVIFSLFDFFSMIDDWLMMMIYYLVQKYNTYLIRGHPYITWAWLRGDRVAKCSRMLTWGRWVYLKCLHEH